MLPFFFIGRQSSFSRGNYIILQTVRLFSGQRRQTTAQKPKRTLIIHIPADHLQRRLNIFRHPVGPDTFFIIQEIADAHFRKFPCNGLFIGIYIPCDHGNILIAVISLCHHPPYGICHICRLIPWFLSYVQPNILCGRLPAPRRIAETISFQKSELSIHLKTIGFLLSSPPRPDWFFYFHRKPVGGLRQGSHRLLTDLKEIFPSMWHIHRHRDIHILAEL